MAEADPERGARSAKKEIAEPLKQSGALDEIFARIDAGEPLTGHEGLLKEEADSHDLDGWANRCLRPFTTTTDCVVLATDQCN